MQTSAERERDRESEELGDSSWKGRARWSWRGAIAFGLALLYGCSFDAGIGGERCSAEGTVDDGYVCRDGRWVRADAGRGAEDGSQGDGSEPAEDVVRCGGDADGCARDGCVPETERETRCDGIDNDCDGEVDEECACIHGATEACYSGPSGTEEVGRCSAGTRECVTGSWEPCRGAVLPADAEMCGNGTDDDCDGVVDEGCSCDFESKPRGVCAGQTRQSDGTCPRPEDYSDGPEEGEWCDGLDNDCDGSVDEDNCTCEEDDSRECYTGPLGTEQNGVCETGTQECVDGRWGSECSGEQTPREETCDDEVDSDCNGVVDNGCPCEFDGTSTGVCGDATRDDSGSCAAPSAYEAEETSCGDGLDNDCDGAIDIDDLDCKGGPGANCSQSHECRGDCVDGECVHRIFVTSGDHDGDLGGLAGADSICGSAAARENLGGTWRALLSAAGTAARDRVALQAPLFNLNGERIADSDRDLWDGEIENPVRFDETGGSRAEEVWTGTTEGGRVDQPRCDDWTSGGLTTGQEGRSDETGEAWIDDEDTVFGFEGRGCGNEFPIYCLEVR